MNSLESKHITLTKKTRQWATKMKWSNTQPRFRLGIFNHKAKGLSLGPYVSNTNQVILDSSGRHDYGPSWTCWHSNAWLAGMLTGIHYVFITFIYEYIHIIYNHAIWYMYSTRNPMWIILAIVICIIMVAPKCKLRQLKHSFRTA